MTCVYDSKANEFEDFEIELEIADVNHLLNFKDDVINLRKIVRKFLINQSFVTKLIGLELGKITHQLQNRHDPNAEILK